jgi:Prolipoprotein diacylglyceryl transferase
MVARVNAWFDRWVRPRVRFAGRSVSAFHYCGIIGVLAAVVLAQSIVVARGGSPLIMSAIVLSSMLTFLALVAGQKVFTGEERIIYYHHEIGVMVVAWLLLRTIGEPPLLYLDATLLGIGAFDACGRVGCTMVGCCHGKPHRLGVLYRPEHADAGFARYYVGIRLFPVQMIEAILVAFVSLSGAWLLWRGAPPGTGLAWYVVFYDSVRFLLEYIRGDDDRPYYGGFSQAQWISEILLVLVVLAEWRGLLPWHTWHAAVAAVMVLTMIVQAIVRRFVHSERERLLHPHHVREVAEALAIASSSRDTIPVAETSRGVLISAGAQHYSLSARGAPMSEEAAEVLASLVRQLMHISAPTELRKGGHGVYHLVVVVGGEG